MEELAATLFTILEKLPRQARPREETALLMMACLKAVVAELSRTGLE